MIKTWDDTFSINLIGYPVAECGVFFLFSSTVSGGIDAGQKGEDTFYEIDTTERELFFNKQEGKGDITYTTGNPDWEKKKEKNYCVRKPAKGVSDGHDDMEEWCPCAEKDMTSMGEFRGWVVIRYCNTEEG